MLGNIMASWSYTPQLARSVDSCKTWIKTGRLLSVTWQASAGERRSNAVNNDRRQRFLDQHRESLRSKGLDPKLARGNSMRSLPMAGALPRPEKHVIQSLKTNKQDMPSAAVLPAPRRVWDGTAPPQSAMAEMENKRGYSVAMPPRLGKMRRNTAAGAVDRESVFLVPSALPPPMLGGVRKAASDAQAKVRRHRSMIALGRARAAKDLS